VALLGFFTFFSFSLAGSRGGQKYSLGHLFTINRS
jgi:hypothetical protein